MPMFIMLVGVPYSGKSYMAEKLSKKYNARIHSNDDLREEMFGNVDCQSRNQELFTELHRRVVATLRSGRNAIYDATNISRSNRCATLALIRKRCNCTCICYYMATPLSICFERKQMRFRVVPDNDIRRMHQTLEPPTVSEGWDEVRVITP